MLREQPCAYFATVGNVSPSTREVSENEAMATRNASKKAVKHKQPAQYNPQRTFTDDEFLTIPSDLQGLDPTQRVVWSNLSSIIKPRGSLFAQKRFSSFANMQKNPSFLNEVGLLPPFYYQSLFLTPDFTPNGMYKVIVNVQGQFRVIIVDDAIPVLESTMQPIWGLDREIPWQLIVLKVWAKVVGGYKNVLIAKPFQFLRTFTYPGWRMKNLDKYDLDGAWRFLSTKLQGDNSQSSMQNTLYNRQINMQELSHTKSAFEPRPGEIQFTIIAKTRNSERVTQCGLVPNAAAYHVVKIFEINGKKAIKISSSIKNRWNGQFSVLDQKVNQFYDPNFHDLTLSKSFIMPFDDFKKLFGLVLLSSINYKQYLSTKHTGYTVQVPPNHRKAQYYRLILKETGFLSFSIIQALENLVPNLPKPPPPVRQTANSNINNNMSDISVNYNMNGAQMSGNNSPQFASSNINGINQTSVRPFSPPNTNSYIPSTPIINNQQQSRIASPITPNIVHSGFQTSQITSSYIPSPMPMDPWMNRNPWSNPPSSFSIGQPGMPQMSQMQQMSPTYPMSPLIPPMGTQANSRVISPIMQLGPQMSSIARPPSVDPWHNTNPWSNPPTGQPSTKGSNAWIPPASSIGPGPQPSYVAHTNYGQMGTTSITANTYSAITPTAVDPWINMSPWDYQLSTQPIVPPIGQPMGIPMGQSAINAPSLISLPTPGPLSNSRMMAQQRESTMISHVSVAQPLQSQMPTSPNASLLVPQLTPGLPPIQPQIGASIYSASKQSSIGLARPGTPLILDQSMNRYPQGVNVGISGVNYQMNNNIPSPVAPNVVNNGYISGPPVTTSAMTGFGQPLANSGYINLLPQNMSYVGQPTGQMAMGIPTQNPWFNTNPWSGPPTTPQQGMRGGGGPFGQQIDPWRNTNPWSGPPDNSQPIQQRPGSSIEQLYGGMSVGGAFNSVIAPPPSVSSSQIYMDRMNRPLSPGVVPNQSSILLGPQMSQMNANPLQPMATSNYTFVQQQSSSFIDPWKNTNPWAGPPNIAGKMSPGQMQPMPTQSMQPIQPMSPRPNQSGSNISAPQQFPSQQINNQMMGSQMNVQMRPNSPFVPPSSPLLLSGIQPPSMVQSTMPQAMVLPPRQHQPSVAFPSQGRQTLSGSGIDPWKNSNPWSNPPAIPVNTSNIQAVSMANSQMMQPSGLQAYQNNNNQQINNSIVNLAIMNATENSSMIRSRNQDQSYNTSSFKPPVLQPFQSPDRQQSQNSFNTNQPMTGASFGSLQGPPTTQTSLAGFQAYVPHNSQLRFLKMKIVLAKLIPNKYNIASKSQGFNIPQDILNEPQDGYQYVDIDQTHGYTAGEAYFLKLPPGEYILHVKPEACARPSSYTINFISQMPLLVSPIALNKTDKSLLLRSCLLDYSRQRGNITHLDQARTEWISYGPTFNELGYGYIGFCVDRNAPERLYCEFNPMRLKEEGYICKDIYKNRPGEVGLFSQNGLGHCLILKQIRPDAIWPPSSIMIYKVN